MVTRAVITGAAGMLGWRLTERLLAGGYEVHGVDVREPEAMPRGLTWSTADIRDTGALRRVLSSGDVLVHCASALPSYPEAEIRSIIVDGARSVLGAAAAAGVHRAVHVSSTAVYGLPSVVLTTEDHPREPVDPYSAAKSAAEEVAEAHRAEGLCVPILRPKTFLGPGRMGLFSMLFEWAAEGRNFPVLGRGDVKIQMFAVEDLVDAVVTVLEAPGEIANDTYNLAATDFGTLREDFQAVLDAAGHGKRVISLPARPALAALDLLRRAGLSPVYGRLLHKLMADSYVSVARAQRRLGFAPKLSNRDAILRTFDWWLAHRRTAGPAPAASGRTSRDPWRQGVLGAAKVFF
ncbi:NAD-dependent epimerase/dehydratase family protein [Longispora albida]|uniref:NAD-dependent epimerase/dehydratase family protein n=1 Tax=Longispora albida TaxID=203523 RepID=UPI00037D5B0B|nr:NAD-dependent epimerase/dehydratase family protein [Longispora albida]